jgi:hypothetical protein
MLLSPFTLILKHYVLPLLDRACAIEALSTPVGHILYEAVYVKQQGMSFFPHKQAVFY